MFSPVESAIARMWESYGEPLSLSDIAKSAILSRFHFCRVFREATGVSPGRFLSAVRIYQAKRLLVSTTLSVTDISLAVGYNSLGSFTNRFTDSVGASPTRFRRMWGEGIHADRDSAPAAQAPHAQSPDGTVTGMVCLPPEYASARVYLGAFETPIIQRRPLSWMVVDTRSASPASYLLASIPPGEWFIRAVAEADSADPEPWTRRSLLVGGQGSVTVTASAVSRVDIPLRPRRPTDLPILFAVPDLERQELLRAEGPAPAIVAPSARAGAVLAMAGAGTVLLRRADPERPRRLGDRYR
jgi:AraC-like DNA-binding protein